MKQRDGQGNEHSETPKLNILLGRRTTVCAMLIPVMAGKFKRLVDVPNRVLSDCRLLAHSDRTRSTSMLRCWKAIHVVRYRHVQACIINVSVLLKESF